MSFFSFVVLPMSICVFLNIEPNNVTSILSLYKVQYSNNITHTPKFTLTNDATITV